MEKFYLAPIPRYNRQCFEFDRSGLNLAATGQQLNTFVIMSIASGSPAAEAGLQVGDEIKTINGLNNTFLDLEGVLRNFRLA